MSLLPREITDAELMEEGFDLLASLTTPIPIYEAISPAPPTKKVVETAAEQVVANPPRMSSQPLVEENKVLSNDRERIVFSLKKPPLVDNPTETMKREACHQEPAHVCSWQVDFYETKKKLRMMQQAAKQFRIHLVVTSLERASPQEEGNCSLSTLCTLSQLQRMKRKFNRIKEANA